MSQNALKKWAHHREQTIALPSGAGEAVVQALNLTEAVVMGRIPNPLIPIAIKAEGGALNKAEFTEDDNKDWLELVCEVVAQCLKEFRPEKGNAVRGPLEKDWVRDEMPPEDRSRVFAVATHIITSDEAMSLLSLSTFRRGAGRPAPPPGVSGDEPEAE